MAATTILAVATAASVAEQRKARKQAEAQAAEERARLEAEQNKPPPRLPTPTDARNARRRSIRSLLARRGRDSTVLTGTGSGLGG